MGSKDLNQIVDIPDTPDQAPLVDVPDTPDQLRRTGSSSEFNHSGNPIWINRGARTHLSGRNKLAFDNVPRGHHHCRGVARGTGEPSYRNENSYELLESSSKLNSRYHKSRDPRNGSLLTNHCGESSPPKRKSNVVGVACEGAGSSMRDAESKQEAVGSVPTSRITGRKRLVRHGCISPLNIAKAKQVGESSSSNGSKDVEQKTGANVTTFDPHHVIDIDEVNGRRYKPLLYKGKGISQSCSSQECNTEDKGFGKSLCYDGSFSDQNPESQVIRNGNFQKSGIDEHDVVVIHDSAPSIASASSSYAAHQSKQLNRQQCVATKSYKRHRKCDATPLAQGNNADAASLGSQKELFGLGSQTNCTSYTQNVTGSTIQIDDSSPDTVLRSSQTTDDIEARARQVEADEMLARELQEQLYQEIPRVRSHDVQGQSRTQLVHNHALQRVTQARNHGSARTSLRSRLNRRRGVTFRQVNASFNSAMDLDLRLELLEILEAAGDDFTMVSQLLNSSREFNENDYELLLALDENNHEHQGASCAQITNLPESIVQNENGESCSVCLEVPAVGDTIRHLPCLHKFHKDCIDPWLQRRSSCPVCKHSI